jgi:hypothetical protein
MQDSRWSRSQEPTIAQLYHLLSASDFAGDSPRIVRTYVEAKLSDGSVVPLFAYQPEALAISSEAFIGLTVARAVALARLYGATDSSSQIVRPPLSTHY